MDGDAIGTRGQALARRLRLAIERGELPRGQRLPPTRDLATAYGISRGTVQAALRELEKMGLIERSPRQRGRIKGDAQAPPPSLSPTSSPPPRHGRIGLIFPHGLTESVAKLISTAHWNSRIVESFQHALTERGWELLTLGWPTERATPDQTPPRLDALKEELAGAFFFTNPSLLGLTEMLDRCRLPWVAINRPGERWTHNFVTAGNGEAGRLVGRCLGRTGRHRVLLLSSPFGMSISSMEKCNGLIDGLLDVGAPLSQVSCVFREPSDEAAGYQAVRQFLAANAAPQAIYAAGDLWAVGAMRACREIGLSTPGDVVVVGTTGLQLSAFTTPSLTVLEQPMEAMGRASAVTLLEMIRQGRHAIPGQVVPARLIVRESFPIDPEMVEEARQGLAVEVETTDGCD